MSAIDEFRAVFGVNGKTPQNRLAADLPGGKTAIIHGYNSRLTELPPGGITCDPETIRFRMATP